VVGCDLCDDAGVMEPAPIPADDAARLAALERYASLEALPSTSFDGITRLAAGIFDVPIALVSMVDAQEQWFRARFGLDVSRTSRDISFCGHAILGDDVMVVLDALDDERFADNPLVVGEPRIRFYAGAPLRTPDGLRIGTLCIIDRRPRVEFSATDRAMLAELAAIVVDEFELQLTTAQLHRRDAELSRYYEIMGASTDYIGLSDPEGVILGLNPAALAMVGLDPDTDVAGRRVSEFHSPEASRRILEVGFRAAIEHGSWRGETDVLRVDGTTIPVDQVILCHRDEDGEITFFSTIARDISDRNEVARLRQVQVMKDEFVSTVSHELRTPLTSIIASLELLDDGVLGALPDDADEVVDVALSNSRRLIRLVDELLDLERLSNGSVEFDRDAVLVADLLDAAVGVVAPTAEGAGIELRVEDRVGTAPRVECDSDQMSRVLVNLLGNAVKFSPHDSTVILRAEILDDDLVLSVIDRGIGIEASAIPKLFEPFWQVDSSAKRSAQGTGLGLAITRRIVEQHVGRIEVESAPGEGSTFRVIIPVHAR